MRQKNTSLDGNTRSMTSDGKGMTSDVDRPSEITSPEIIVAKDILQLWRHAGKDNDRDQFDTNVDIDGGFKLMKLGLRTSRCI